MRVPLHLALLRRLIGVPLVCLTTLAFGYARGPQPDLRIPLEPLGFQPLTQQFLLAGSSMLTLDFVDNQHLLVTFEVRTLLKRIPGDPPTDQDRVVHALLLELPSGRILAHADWRLHDRGQYLWSLGQGHFLLRIRDTLTTFSPLAHLSTGDPFGQRPLINIIGRHVGALMLTPDADVLTVETKADTPPDADTSAPTASGSPSRPADPDPVQINFYRIANSGDAVYARYAGAGRSPAFGSFALTTAGYLDTLDQGRQHWAFNFDTFTGKTLELAAFDSSCRPTPLFVSHSEFIAFGCHGTDSPQVLGGFNMRGEQMWQQGLFGDYLAPHFVFAPASGRFAFGRLLTTTPFADTTPLVAETISAQSVAVFQTNTGKQILKVECTPVEPAGGNFALSPDGLNLGIVHNGAIEIYKLPALTAKEQAAVKLAQSSSPETTNLPVHFAAGASPSATEASSAETAQPAAAPPAPAQQPAPAPATNTAAATPASQPQKPPAQPATTQSATTPSSESASGDQQPDQPRKPPTLYTLPTDPPHNQPDNQPK